MKITVDKDNVKIEEFDVVHEGEHRVNKCSFSFSEEYTEELVKKAIFTSQNSSVEVAIINNECNIPTEILKARNIVLLGVYAYKVVDDKLDLRYSPSPDAFKVNSGSYIEGASESEEITPSQFEQYMQALNDGLNKVEESIKKMDEATSSAMQLVDNINQKLENGDFIGPEGSQGPQGIPGKDGTNGKDGADGVGITTITSGQSTVEADKTITPVIVQKTDGSSESFNVEAKNGLDGQNGQDGVNGQDGLTPSIGENGNWYLGDTDTGKPSRGEVGPSPDLTDYVKNTDYATATKAGVIKATNYLNVTSDGVAYASPITQEIYESTNPNVFIAKGTLENIKDYYVGSSNPVITLNNTLDNLVRKNRVSDYIVSLKDALKYKVFEFLVHGKTQQKTTTGKNKFDISSLINRTQTIGASTGNIYTLKPNTQYTVSTNMVSSNTDDSIPIIGIPQSINAFIFVSSDTTIEAISSAYNGVGTTNNITRTLMTDDTGNIFVGIRESVSSSLSNLISKGGYVQIEEGSTATSYEPYTGGQPSPSPDYPQEITTLTFDKLTRCGKNLYNVTDIYTYYIDAVGEDVSVDEEGWITIDVDNSQSSSEKFNNYWTKFSNSLKPNTKYNIFLEIKEVSGTSGYISVVSETYNSQFNNSFLLNLKDISGNSIKNKICITKQNHMEENMTMLRTFLSTPANSKNKITFRISVIEDVTVTPQNFVYEPYQATEYAIDLQGNEMVELPNSVKDELVVDKYGNVSLIKNVDKVVYDGINKKVYVKHSSFLSDTKGFYLCTIDNKNKYFDSGYTKAIKCDSLIARSGNAQTAFNNYDSGIWWEGNTNNVYMILSLTTIDEVNNWLQEHNVTFYYQLENPEVIPLGTLSELITTEEGINTFFINGNLETTLEVLYARDSEKYLQQYIDDKLAALSQALIEEG